MAYMAFSSRKPNSLSTGSSKLPIDGYKDGDQLQQKWNLKNRFENVKFQFQMCEFKFYNLFSEEILNFYFIIKHPISNVTFYFIALSTYTQCTPITSAIKI
jgi:hypothetical protein